MPDHDTIHDALKCEQCVPTEKLIAELAARENMVGADNDVLKRLSDVIEYIIDCDLPELTVTEHDTLVGHLTGAVYVTVRNA